MRLLLATSLILSGCVANRVPPTPTPALGAEFSLEQGASVAIDGKWLVRFVGVAEDSRCPMNARCIWEGNARIRVRVQELPRPFNPSGESAPANLELNTSERFEKKAVRAGAVVELLHLEPTPLTGVPTKDYVATLVVKAAT